MRRQSALVGGLDELVDELGGGHVADPAALLAGGHAEADQQVRLSRARVTEQHDGLAGWKESAAGEHREASPG